MNLGVERISQESQLEQKDVYKNQLQGNKKFQLFKNAIYLLSGDLVMAKSVKVVNKVVNMEKNAAVGQEENFATTALTSTSTSLSSAYSSILQATSLHLI